MPYTNINPTGCGIHKNRAKIRLDFFLNPDDPNYDKHHVYVVDETSKEYQKDYQGKLDDEGSPIDPEDYQQWFDGLPHIWRDNPFHSHILRIDKDISDAEVRSKIESCLNYFYQFHQYCWGEGKEFIEEWKKVSIKKGTVRERFISGDAKDVSKHEAKVQDIVARHDEFQFNPIEIPLQDLRIGKKGTIDVGCAAIDRPSFATLKGPTIYNTWGNFGNPANEDGVIDTVEAWFSTADSGNSVKYGTFFDPGGYMWRKCRDAEVYGEVSTGSKQTCTGLSIDIVTGDELGADARAAPKLALERTRSGGEDVWYRTGQHCDPNDEFQYSDVLGDILSLYGIGGEPAADHRRAAFLQMF